MDAENAFPEGSSRAAKVLRTVTATIQHHGALMRQARALYRAGDRPLHKEPTTMHWIDRYLRFYDSKPLYRLDTNHATAFLSFNTTTATCKEAEEALQFFHRWVMHRPLPKQLAYHVRETHAPKDSPLPDADRRLWSE